MKTYRILAIVLLVLAASAAFSQTPNDANTSAFFAALDQDEVDLEVVRKLLEQNPALVNAKSEDGYTPLHIAAGYGQEEVIKLLLSMHADVNTRSIELLLAAKADVNAADEDGDTALHMVGSKADAELLLANGANIEARNR